MNYISENILDYITSIYGDNLTKSYQTLINQEPTQFIRVSPKISAQELSLALKQRYNIECHKVSNYTNILKVIDNNNLLGKTLEHILGYYYIQSYSSFIPPLVLNPNGNDVVLDLCAAPGSKTTELSEIMNNKGTIVANEVRLDRLKSLVHNIDRMNQINVGVTHFKGEQLNTIYSNYFDKILVDAPCSGLGIVQKKIEVNDWWTFERVRRLSELQLKLLVSAIKMTKIDGEIVYSTCTLTVEENELIIDKIIKKYPVEVVAFNIQIPSKNGITFYKNQSFNSSLDKAKRILPWEVESDGFFIIKLKKIAKTEPSYRRDLQLRDIKLLEFDDRKINEYLKNIQNDWGIEEEIFSKFKFILKSNNIFFVDGNWYDPNPGLFGRIGTHFGVINKNNNVVLDSHAAQVLSAHIKENIIEIKNLSELNSYLKGETIKSINVPRGQYIVQHKNYTLGTAVSTAGGLKSQFPRAFRTQEIRLMN